MLYSPRVMDTQMLPDTEGGVLERVVPFLAALIVATAAELWGTRESGA